MAIEILLSNKNVAFGASGGSNGSLPPESQLCPARGGAQIEPRDWYSLSILPGTHLPGTRVMPESLGSIPDRSGPPGGGGPVTSPVTSTAPSMMVRPPL